MHMNREVTRLVPGLGLLLAVCSCTSHETKSPTAKPMPPPKTTAATTPAKTTTTQPGAAAAGTAAAGTGAAGTAAGTPAAKPVEITNDVTATAQVTAVDPDTRQVTLRRDDGSLVQVTASNDVRNFEQIVTGDILRVRYKEVLRASLSPPGASDKPTSDVMTARRPEGAKPGAAAAATTSVPVRIESIDREHDIVVFSLPSGELISHRIATPEGRQFVQGLKVGDRVQLDIEKAFAVAIDKV